MSNQGTEHGRRTGWLLWAVVVLIGSLLGIIVGYLVVTRVLGPRPVPATPTTIVQRPSPTGTATWTSSPTSTPTITPGPTATPTRTRTPSPTPTPTPIVVITHINALGRYEAVNYLLQVIVPLSKNDLPREVSSIWDRWQLVCGQDRLLLVAGGEVIAGFDLSRIQPEDIVVQGRSVRLSLPPPEILESFLHEDETEVTWRGTSILCRPDPQLETEARRRAEPAIRDRALEGGILDKAEQFGRSQLTEFLRSLGFTDITITTWE